MRNRLIITFIFALIVCLGVGISWRMSMIADEINAQTRLLVNQKLPTVRLIERVRGLASEYERVLYEYYAALDQEQAHRSLSPLDNSIRNSLNKLASNVDNDSLVAQVTDLFAKMQTVEKVLDTNLGNYGKGDVDWDLAREQLSEISALGRQLDPVLDRLSSDSEKQAGQSREYTFAISSSIRHEVYSYTIFVAIIAGLVAFYMSRYLGSEKKRRQAKLQLQYLALYDSQTGLPNRHNFEKALDQLLGSSSQSFGLALITLDNMQRISNHYGYRAVEELLKQAAARIVESLDKQNLDRMLYRLDGFMLALVVPQANLKVVEDMTSSLLAVMQEAFVIGDGPFYISLSIGYAMFPEHGCTLEVLTKNADTALTRATREHSNRAFAYDEQMFELEQSVYQMEKNLELAIDKGQFQLFYQPKVLAESCECTSFEALIRWHTDGEWIQPDIFIPLAEQSGLILPIGQWVLEEACRQIKAWTELGRTGFSVAVNVSPRQFQQRGFASRLKSTIERAGIEAKYLELEITETVTLDHVEQAILTMEAVCKIGVTLSIDDFGTGYSSLAYLRRFPISKIKIDKSFIDRVTEDKEGLAIVKAIVELAHHLKLKVVAEGVEHQNQLQTLQQLACDEIQGYLISKPCCAQDLESFLQRFEAL